jgi:predicted RNA-binding protein with PUA-like domain
MKKMKIGDLGFFYHSVKEKQIVGVVRVIGEHRPDPTDKKGIFGMVVIEAVKEVKKYVTLSEMKSNPKLSDLALIKQARLSVVPITKSHWNEICLMAETESKF